MTEPVDIQRRLVAVFAADVEGYSRLMGADEVGTLKGLTDRRAILDRAIVDHRGRIANTAGDSVLAEFGSAVDAVQCAVAVQAALAEANAGLPVEKRINFRIGIHVGDVMVRAGDLFGDGVNIAARLQTLAQPGGVCLSGETYGQVRKILPVAFTDLGIQQVKNIEEPVRAYAVAALSQSIAPGPDTDKLLLPDKPSIAVLPFLNMSGDPEQEYFADGMVEDIITALSRKRELFVIARNSSFTYKHKAVDIRQVGRDLGVRYVLEGSVRKAGGKVRITGQLIEAASGTHLWADRFDGALEDVFDLQDRVTSSVVGAIAPHLEQAEIARIRTKPTENLEAYDCYLRALSSTYEFTREANLQAYTWAVAATRLDPTFALCHAVAANSFVQRRAFVWSVSEADEQAEAKSLIDRALEFGKNDPLVVAMVGQTQSVVFRDPVEGLAFLERAIALDPNLASARYWAGNTLLYVGEPERAIEQFNMALRLSPVDPRIFVAQAGMAFAHFFAGRYDDSREWAERTVRQQPNFPNGPRVLCASLAMQGRIAQAQAAVARALEITPDWSISRFLENAYFQSQVHRDALAAAYRIAGVPE